MSARPLRTVGVLGGMGPEATVMFMRRVIAAVQAGEDSDHIPLLVDNNTQVPSRIKALVEGGGADPGPVLSAMAMRLQAAGAEALVMPCNTAHNYSGSITEAASIPFLSMVELTAEKIAREAPGAGVGIIASPAVKLTELFERPLRAHELRPIYPTDQDALLTAIKALKVSAGDRQALALTLAGALDALGQGADVLLVGCSEFSLITREIAALGRVVDSLDVLVAEAVAFSTGAENQ